ncbi:hypothetical protein BFJ69_g8888 [Fusarium oxysporum]|uniref:Uncharacterized protein n=1 Tax=Fusarium oxysporum TaxID=5507 RepID=A0A420N0S9_FUSOX|nr:hypothetical protein BFJ69_g8888 [Fusarium oxysporum]
MKAKETDQWLQKWVLAAGASSSSLSAGIPGSQPSISPSR